MDNPTDQPTSAAEPTGQSAAVTVDDLAEIRRKMAEGRKERRRRALILGAVLAVLLIAIVAIYLARPAGVARPAELARGPRAGRAPGLATGGGAPAGAAADVGPVPDYRRMAAPWAPPGVIGAPARPAVPAAAPARPAPEQFADSRLASGSAADTDAVRLWSSAVDLLRGHSREYDPNRDRDPLRQDTDLVRELRGIGARLDALKGEVTKEMRPELSLMLSRLSDFCEQRYAAEPDWVSGEQWVNQDGRWTRTPIPR